MTDNQELVKIEPQSQALQSQSSREEQAAKISHLMTTGDISKMTKAQKDQFLIDLARAHNLMPWPPPFMIIPGQGGKEIIYANKSCADQLRKIHGISIEIVFQGALPENPDIYCVRAKATDRDGRTDEEAGTVWTKGKVGDDLSNAILRAYTKAKRRVTYSISGLSLLDETEVQSMNISQVPQNGPRQISPAPSNFSRPSLDSGAIIDAQEMKAPMEAPK